jgi:ferredoxin-nitrite reductase
VDVPTDVERWKSEVYGSEIREHLFGFAERGRESIPEDERDAWFERFKWWGLYHQRKGRESYFMLRVGTPNGVLEPGQAEVVADVAREFARGPVPNPEFGNGYVDWTTRQSSQLHWIGLEDVPGIFDRLESAGLSTRQACGDSWRNIVGCPVDGEQVRGFNVRVGGGLARNEERFARDIDVFVTPEEAVEVGGAVSALFREYGDREDRYAARMKFLVDEWGPGKVRRVLEEEFVDGELRSAGEDLRGEYSHDAGTATGGDYDHVSVHEQANGNYYVGLNVLVGRMGADDVAELARVADEYGSGEVRVTQRQNVLVTDVPGSALDDLLAEPLLEHYSPDPHPFERGSVACTGTEFCSLSIVETKNRQVRFARWLGANAEVPDGVEDFHVHLSECTASCAQPQIADVSLRGMKTRKDGEAAEVLDIGGGGGLGEEPRFATWIRQRVPVDEVPGTIRNLLAGYEAHREDGETFRAFVERHEDDEAFLAELTAPEETDYDDPMMHDAKMTWYPYADEDAMDASPAPKAVGEPVSGDD